MTTQHEDETRHGAPGGAELEAALALQAAMMQRSATATSLDEARAIARETARERARGAVPAGTTVTTDQLGGVPVQWVAAQGTESLPVVLYVHGGGFMVGGLDQDDFLLARLSAASGGRSVTVDYRLAPEHPYPAALDDVRTAYEALVAEVAPSEVVVCGESVGGGLVLLLLQALRDHGLPAPAAGVLISSVLDFTASGASYETNAERDQFISRPAVQGAAAAWLGGRDPAAHSPLAGELAGLPPLLVQVGADEALIDDSRRLAERVRVAGGEVELEVWEGVLHLWQGYPGLPPSSAATQRIAAFVKRHVRSHIR